MDTDQPDAQEREERGLRPRSRTVSDDPAMQFVGYLRPEAGALADAGATDAAEASHVDDEPHGHDPKARRKRDGHTLRRRVGPPASHSFGRRYRLAAGERYDQVVRDFEHVPATKTHGCKLFEHPSGRQWLKNRRRYENHVERRERKSAAEREADA